MEPCTIADIEADFDDLVASIAAAQGIDPICSRSDWIIPAAAAFAPSAEPRVFTAATGHIALLEHPHASGSVLSSFDAMWGFATPLIGRDPERIATDFDAVRRRIVHRLAVVSGVDASGPLFRALLALGPVGFSDTADRCVADLRDGFDAWLDRRSPRFRRSLRAAANRGAARGVTIEQLAPATHAEVAAAFGRILAVEVASWKADARSGLVDTDLGFFTQAMSRRFAARGELRVDFARLDGDDIGYVIGARLGRRYRGFQHSFDRRHAQLSVGKLMQFHAIAALAAEGVVAYDMGMAMPYKQSYADRTESTITLVFTP